MPQNSLRTYPMSYLKVPSCLEIVQAPTSVEELENAARIRSRFLFHGENLPYMEDVTRASRLLCGIKRYIEVGTYDKGCLAYMSTIIADDAILIDVDIEARPEQTRKLVQILKPKQKLVTIVGDSTSQEIQQQIINALQGFKVDAVFIDANHTAPYVLADYCSFEPLVKTGGLILFHDVYWEGDESCFGTRRALEWIDRQEPCYIIETSNAPVHRFLPIMHKKETRWGGVGIILK